MARTGEKGTTEWAAGGARRRRENTTRVGDRTVWGWSGEVRLEVVGQMCWSWTGLNRMLLLLWCDGCSGKGKGRIGRQGRAGAGGYHVK